MMIVVVVVVVVVSSSNVLPLPNLRHAVYILMK